MMTKFKTMARTLVSTMSDLAQEALEAPSKGVISELTDLSSQQRKMLLTQPMSQLYFSRNRFVSEGETPLFERLDTQYLFLWALNFIMEGSAMAAGCTMDDVRDSLTATISRIRPENSDATCRQAADVVLEAIHNNHEEFASGYFHAPSMTMLTFRFRLVILEPDMESIYRYRPSKEGYLLLIGMLDIDVEDQQILMERMLQILIERGRIQQAKEVARNARVLSIEYAQQINEFLLQMRRSPGSVKWERDLAPRLNSARSHVSERQGEDLKLKMAVESQLDVVETQSSKDELIELKDIISASSAVRARLQRDITSTEKNFLDAQISAFRPKKHSGVPDLETTILPTVLKAPIKRFAQVAEEIYLSVFPAVFPKVPDLSDLLALLLERRSTNEPAPPNDDGHIEAFEDWPDPFPEQLVADVLAWIKLKLMDNRPWKLDELIAAGEAEGFDHKRLQCIGILMYLSYPDSESAFPARHAVADGTFETFVVSGDNLRFDLKSASQEPSDG